MEQEGLHYLFFMYYRGMQFENLSPYVAKLYPAMTAADPFYWTCVVKASFHCDPSGNWSLLSQQIPLCEYDHFDPHYPKHYLSQCHETMAAKCNAEFIVVWQHYPTHLKSNKKFFVQCKQRITYIKSTRKLWQLSYLAPSHPQRRLQNLTSMSRTNVAACDQRIRYPFSGNEEVSWWWQTHPLTLTPPAITTFCIPVIKLKLQLMLSNHAKTYTLKWDTLVIIPDAKQCHLLGRMSLPCELNHYADGRVQLNVMS